MRYDACRCTGLNGRPLQTTTKDEDWKPCPDTPDVVYVIRRCPRCNKPRSIDRKGAPPKEGA